MESDWKSVMEVCIRTGYYDPNVMECKVELLFVAANQNMEETESDTRKMPLDVLINA